MYNYKTAQIKNQYIYLDKSHLMNLCQNSNSNQQRNRFHLELLNFNENVMLLEGYYSNDRSLKTIFMLNRNDNYNVIKYLTIVNSFTWCKFYNSDMYILNNENDKFSFKIYDTNSISTDALAVFGEENFVRNDEFNCVAFIQHQIIYTF
jgi:hypothetical protein